MRIETFTTVDAFTIYDGEMPANRGVLDPVTVFLRDFGGSGQIVVECYGAAWSHWFGAFGQTTLRKFIGGCDAGYLADKLISTTFRRPTKREEIYLYRICSAVVFSLKGGAA